MANGIITLNPALTIPMRFITQARPRTRALSPGELRIYLQTLYQSNIRRQFKLALHQILLTLVRKSELIFGVGSMWTLSRRVADPSGELQNQGSAHRLSLSSVRRPILELQSLPVGPLGLYRAEAAWPSPSRPRP